MTKEPMTFETIADDNAWTAEQRAAYGALPNSLRKSFLDPFDYALRLTTGEVVYFEVATFADPAGRWLKLTPSRLGHGDATMSGLPIGAGRPIFDRGIEVKIDQIVWAADAPFG